MKNIFLLAAAFYCLVAKGQSNPFSTTQFKTTFTKLYAEAATGFKSQRGVKMKTELGSLIEQYKVKTLLPGTVSGHVEIPFVGTCKLHYSLKIERTKAEAERRRTQMMAAIEKVLNKKLYVRETQTTIKQFIFYYKYYYTSPVTSSNQSSPDFETYIIENKKQFTLNVDIPGDCTEVVKKPALEELDVNGKLLAMYNDAASHFATIKNVKTKSNQHYTDYDTRLTLFGVKGEVNDGKYNVVLKYSYGLMLFNTAQEAEKIYLRLKAGLIKVLEGKISFGEEQQSKYDAKSYSIQGFEPGKSFMTSKLTVRLAVTLDEKYPGVLLTFDKTKY